LAELARLAPTCVPRHSTAVSFDLTGVRLSSTGVRFDLAHAPAPME